MRHQVGGWPVGLGGWLATAAGGGGGERRGFRRAASAGVVAGSAEIVSPDRPRARCLLGHPGRSTYVVRWNSESAPTSPGVSSHGAVHGAVTSSPSRWVFADQAVERLTDQVGVADVTGVFLDHVDQKPADAG